MEKSMKAERERVWLWRCSEGKGKEEVELRQAGNQQTQNV